MTDEELKALVAENSLAIRELRASSRESSQETERLWQEIRASRQASEKRWQESRQEAERLWQEIVVSRQETDRLISSFNQQLGRLGNKLGDYTESLFRPSLERTMREQFGMTTILSPLHIRRNGDHLEIDMVGHAEDERREVYLAEIKSQLRQDGIDQILEDLRQFPRFFPEHRGKKLFGILGALDVPENLRAQVINKGLYLATIKDDVFEISPPDGFTPRAFGLREA